MIIDVFVMIEDHIRYKYPEYDWNKDPLSLTLLGTNLHNRLYPKTDPGWSKEKWLAFYNAVKPFMEE